MTTVRLRSSLLASTAVLWVLVLSLADEPHDFHLALIAVAAVALGVTCNHLINLHLIHAHRTQLHAHEQVLNYGISIGREEMRQEMQAQLRVVVPFRPRVEDCPPSVLPTNGAAKISAT